jgi:hypothetical protein
MAADEKWYFSKEQLANTPSRKCGFEVDKELSYRQQAANFIQDMGQRLQVYPFLRKKNVMLVYIECEVVFLKIYRSVLVNKIFQWVMRTDLHYTISYYLLRCFRMVETCGSLYLPFVRKLHFLENESYMACFMYFTPRHIDHVILAVNITKQHKQFSL